MPTVLRSGPYRVYFFSHEPNEPPHVHVDRDDLSAKFWLQPLALARKFGFRRENYGDSEPRKNYWRLGMGILALSADERVRDVHVSEDTLTVDLMDGRTISVPLIWYPRLFSGTAKQRSNWKGSAAGYGIHWPDLDEDLSTEGLLRGAPAPARPARRLTNRSKRERKTRRA